MTQREQAMKEKKKRLTGLPSKLKNFYAANDTSKK